MLAHAELLPLAICCIAAGGMGALLLVRYELRLAAPMLPIDLLKQPIFALSALTSLCSFSAQALAFVCLPFLIHDELQRSVSETGFLITTWPIAAAGAAFVSGRLADRLPAGMLAAAGLSTFAAGLLSLALLPVAPSNADLLWRLFVAGVGFGIFQAPNNRIFLASAPRSRSGGANGIQSMGRLLGQSIGVALLAIIFGMVTAEPLPVAFWLAAVLAAAGIIPSAMRRFKAASLIPDDLE